MMYGETSGRSNPYVKLSYYLTKIWGLAPFTLEENKAVCKSSVEIIYPLVLTAMCVFELILIAIHRSKMAYIGETSMTRIVDNFSLLARVMGSVSFLMIFTIRRKSVVYVLNSFLKCDATLQRCLGVGQDNEKRLKTRVLLGCTILVIRLVIGFVLNILHILYFATTRGLDIWIIFLWIFGSWMCFMQHIFVIIFVIVTMSLEDRFNLINQSIYTLYRPECNFVKNRVHRCVTTLEKLIKIAQVRSELHDVTEKAMGLFSLQIILTIVYYCITITNICYYTFATAEGYVMRMKSAALVEFVCAFMFSGLVLLELIVIAVVCDSTQSTVRICPYLSR